MPIILEFDQPVLVAGASGQYSPFYLELDAALNSSLTTGEMLLPTLMGSAAWYRSPFSGGSTALRLDYVVGARDKSDDLRPVFSLALRSNPDAEKAATIVAAYDGLTASPVRANLTLPLPLGGLKRDWFTPSASSTHSIEIVSQFETFGGFGF